MEKFVRTTGGSIWQLGQDGNYHKPGVDNFVKRDSDCVEAASDEMYKLIRVGDLVKFKHVDLKIREIVEKDTIGGPDFAKHWQFDAIYVPVIENGVVKLYELEAVEIAGTWCAM